jgi:nicotinamidase-related amidase
MPLAATRSRGRPSARLQAQRGYKVIVAVDCSAGEDVYHEQYAAFDLAKEAPRG